MPFFGGDESQVLTQVFLFIIFSQSNEFIHIFSNTIYLVCTLTSQFVSLKHIKKITLTSKMGIKFASELKCFRCMSASLSRAHAGAP